MDCVAGELKKRNSGFTGDALFTINRNKILLTIDSMHKRRFAPLQIQSLDVPKLKKLHALVVRITNDKG